MIFWSAFVIGILGSFHCIGMCGPIALALPIQSETKLNKVIKAFVYNFGRVVTYAVLGTLFGLIGKSFVIAGWQQYLSIILGVMILLVLIFSKQINAAQSSIKFLSPAVNFIKRNIGTLFKQKTNGALFLIGLLNGLLPCGLVYTAIAGAIATGSALDGALFMGAFGLGTLPIMVAVVFLGTFVTISVRQKLRKAVPIFVGALALMLILRGLNLGIPYISPKMSKDKPAAECCSKPKKH